MSNHEEDFGQSFANAPRARYYECTCCGVRDSSPVICGCHDEFCRTCHCCRTCCKSPGLHFRLSYTARTEQEDIDAFLKWYDGPEHDVSVRRMVQPVHPRAPLDGHTHAPGEYCHGCADMFRAEIEGCHRDEHLRIMDKEGFPIYTPSVGYSRNALTLGDLFFLWDLRIRADEDIA